MAVSIKTRVAVGRSRSEISFLRPDVASEKRPDTTYRGDIARRGVCESICHTLTILSQTVDASVDHQRQSRTSQLKCAVQRETGVYLRRFKAEGKAACLPCVCVYCGIHSTPLVLSRYHKLSVLDDHPPTMHTVWLCVIFLLEFVWQTPPTWQQGKCPYVHAMMHFVN
jgi:hypothetical protein